jgi:hypothetical protein
MVLSSRSAIKGASKEKKLDFEQKIRPRLAKSARKPKNFKQIMTDEPVFLRSPGSPRSDTTKKVQSARKTVALRKSYKKEYEKHVELGEKDRLYSSRRTIAYDDNNSDIGDGPIVENKGQLIYSNNIGKIFRLDPNPRFQKYKNQFTNLLKRN